VYSPHRSKTEPPLQGLFTHDDLDKPFQSQSPCGEEPKGITRARQRQTDQWVEHATKAAQVIVSDDQTTQPLVTILIPVYNGASHEYLHESIASAMAQTITPVPEHQHRPPWSLIEIICINDGSTDNTLEMLLDLQQNEFPSITIVDAEKNVGLPAALNLGLRHSHGKYITWTSSDNTMQPNMLSVLYAFATRYPEVDLFFGDWNMVEPNSNDGSNDHEHDVHIKNKNEMHIAFSSQDYRTPEHILLGWKGAAAFMWRHRGIKFDESLGGAEDVEMWLRVAERSKLSLWIYGTSLYTYRLHGGWSGLSISGKLRKIVTKMAQKTIQRHQKSMVSNPEGKFILDPTKLLPSWRMCVDRDMCTAHGYLLLGNDIIDVSDREGLRSALFHGLCHYYIEAIRFAKKSIRERFRQIHRTKQSSNNDNSFLIAANINLALCYVVAGEVGMAKDAAEALFYDLGIDVPWNNNNGSSNNGSSNNGSSNNGSSNRNTTILLVASNLGPYLNQLKQMLVNVVSSLLLYIV
jgi:glycosyltransferase involved in cell wall biosynthesis